MNKYAQACLALSLAFVIYGLFGDLSGLELASRLYWAFWGVAVVYVTEKIQSLGEA